MATRGACRSRLQRDAPHRPEASRCKRDLPSRASDAWAHVGHVCNVTLRIGQGRHAPSVTYSLVLATRGAEIRPILSENQPVGLRPLSPTALASGLRRGHRYPNILSTLISRSTKLYTDPCASSESGTWRWKHRGHQRPCHCQKGCFGVELARRQTRTPYV